jgi:hypothetical protein
MLLGRGLDSVRSGWGPLAGLYYHGDEPSGCKNDAKFLVLLNAYHLPEIDTVLWTSCLKIITSRILKYWL